jgi:hypothetical protein
MNQPFGEIDDKIYCHDCLEDLMRREISSNFSGTAFKKHTNVNRFESPRQSEEKFKQGEKSRDIESTTVPRNYWLSDVSQPHQILDVEGLGYHNASGTLSS